MSATVASNAAPDTTPHAAPATFPPVAAPAKPTHSAFVPLLIVLLALLAWFVASALEVRNQGQALKAAHAAQQQTVDNAAKLRGSLDALAADTQRLAVAGNPNAALLVEELRKRGVTINVPAPGAAPAAPAASR